MKTKSELKIQRAVLYLSVSIARLDDKVSKEEAQKECTKELNELI